MCVVAGSLLQRVEAAAAAAAADGRLQWRMTSRLSAHTRDVAWSVTSLFTTLLVTVTTHRPISVVIFQVSLGVVKHHEARLKHRALCFE